MMESNSVEALSGQSQERGSVWSHRYFLMAVIVVASVAVRLAALAYWGTGAIESEGTEYATIAQNLRNGIGYVGMTSPGSQIVFPPLFPVLIAALSFLTHDYEWAGRIVSLIFQSLVPLAVFGIASRLYNRTTGLVAAALAIFSPLLVNLSFLVLSEAVYVALLFWGIYAVLLALERPSVGRYLMVGGLFGLAYLTRQEAVAPLFVAVFLTVCFAGGSLVVRGKWAAVALAMFAIVALPEVIHLYKATGAIRLEEKSSLFYVEQVRTAVAEQNGEALPGEWAEHSVDDNAERTGTSNRPQVDVVREAHVSRRQLLHNLKLGVKRNVPTLLQQLTARWMGAPFLPALALLGFFRRPWKRALIPSHLYFVMVPLTAVVATFSFSGWTAIRYYFVFIPFLLIWAANGVVGIGLWKEATLAATGWNWIPPALAKWAAAGLVALIVTVYPVAGVRSLFYWQQDSRATTQEIKKLGLWIAQQQNRQVKIMDRSTPLAFHANAKWVYAPYTMNEDVALRFLDKEQVDYVILRQGEKYTPYYQEWLAKGIPDPRAEKVNAAKDANGNEIEVYRWHSEEKK
jgi:4-amino-4-deoxy-L-arabinose transferase-like glycosyltransferase